MLIPGYEVYQELSCNPWFRLSRGCCQADGSPVLLKTPCTELPSALAERLLAHEHDVLQGLVLSGVIRARAFLRHDRECCLVLEDRGEGSLQALLALDEVQSLPRSMVHYVRRTAESIVLTDAQRDDSYGSDPYIVEHKPCSVMCLPVLNQARLVGILYLEHTAVSGVFTPARIQVLQMLSSQAAIALENAQLYDEMKQEVDYRRQAEEALRATLAELEMLKNRLQAENVYLQEELRHEHNFEEIVGNSPALLGMLRQIESVAATDATVLICGETGTGKELVARALHDRSARQARPLVKVNCGAISAGLVESEIFGHVKGAFTGDRATRFWRRGAT